MKSPGSATITTRSQSVVSCLYRAVNIQCQNVYKETKEKISKETITRSPGSVIVKNSSLLRHQEKEQKKARPQNMDKQIGSQQSDQLLLPPVR